MKQALKNLLYDSWQAFQIVVTALAAHACITDDSASNVYFFIASRLVGLFAFTMALVGLKNFLKNR